MAFTLFYWIVTIFIKTLKLLSKNIFNPIYANVIGIQLFCNIYGVSSMQLALPHLCRMYGELIMQ